MPIPESCAALDLPWRSDRLVLRALEPGDFDALFVLCTHPEICRYIRPPMTEDQVREHLTDRRRPWFFEERKWYSLAVSEVPAPRVIGELVFRLESRADRRAEIGYRFHPDAHGKGYASESVGVLITKLFEVVGLHKLVAYCDAANDASNRLLTRLGMRREGVLRAQYWYRDQWCDMISYGLLETEHAADA